MALKMPWRIEVPEAFIAVDEGTVWTDGGSRVEVIHVPGHTPGSLVLLIDGRAFTGDTLYRQGVWLGSMPESDHDRLVTSLHRLWDLLPEDMPVYPGHGRSADFGVIRRQNAPLLELLGSRRTRGPRRDEAGVMKRADIRAIAYALPDRVVTNEMLSDGEPDVGHAARDVAHGRGDPVHRRAR